MSNPQIQNRSQGVNPTSLPTNHSWSSHESIELNSTNLGLFERSLKQLEIDLDQIRSNQDRHLHPHDCRLETLSCLSTNLMHHFNDFMNQNQNDAHAPILLSKFDQKRLLNKLKDIESQIRTLQSQSIQTEERAASVLKPKKFSFKKSTDPSLPGTAATFQERRRTVPDELLANESVDPLNLKPHSQNLFIQPPAPLAPLHTLALSNLSSVVIDLRNFTSHLSILRLSQLHRTAVLAPSLSGSASLIQVSNSLLVSVCQQLRTYECHDLIFLLHTTTSPVIESSTQISLAPYPFELFPRTSSSAIIDPQSSQHGLAHDFEFPDGPPTNISPNLTILPTSPISNEDLTDLFQPQDLRTSADAHLPPGCFDLPEPARIRLMNL